MGWYVRVEPLVVVGNITSMSPLFEPFQALKQIKRKVTVTEEDKAI